MLCGPDAWDLKGLLCNSCLFSEFELKSSVYYGYSYFLEIIQLFFHKNSKYGTYPNFILSLCQYFSFLLHSFVLFANSTNTSKYLVTLRYSFPVGSKYDASWLFYSFFPSTFSKCRGELNIVMKLLNVSPRNHGETLTNDFCHCK